MSVTDYLIDKIDKSLRSNSLLDCWAGLVWVIVFAAVVAAPLIAIALLVVILRSCL